MASHIETSRARIWLVPCPLHIPIYSLILFIALSARLPCAVTLSHFILTSLMKFHTVEPGDFTGRHGLPMTPSISQLRRLIAKVGESQWLAPCFVWLKMVWGGKGWKCRRGKKLAAAPGQAVPRQYWLILIYCKIGKYMIWFKRRKVLHECDLHASRFQTDLLSNICYSIIFNRYISRSCFTSKLEPRYGRLAVNTSLFVKVFGLWSDPMWVHRVGRAGYIS